MIDRLAIITFCTAVACTVALAACDRVSPSRRPDPGNEPTLTATIEPSVTVTPPAGGPTKITIPQVDPPTPSSKGIDPAGCGIPGAACETTTPSTTRPGEPSSRGAPPPTTS